MTKPKTRKFYKEKGDGFDTKNFHKKRPKKTLQRKNAFKKTKEGKNGSGIKKNATLDAKAKRVSFGKVFKQNENDLPKEHDLEKIPEKGILRRASLNSNTSFVVLEKKEDEPQKAVKSQKEVIPKLLLSKSQKKTLKNSKLKLNKEQRLNMSKLNQKQKKQYLKEIKSKDPALAFSMQLKRLWNVARNSTAKAEDRDASYKNLLELTKGRAVELIYCHDTSRILSFLISGKNGKEARETILEELTPELIKMSKTLYSYQFVLKMLKYGYLIYVSYDI